MSRVRRPQVSFVVDEAVLETVRRVAAVQGKSVSRLVAELVTSLEPGLRPIADLGEAMLLLDEARRAGVRAAVERGEPEVQAAMARAVEAWAQAADDVRASVGRDPQLSNRGVR